MKRRAPPSLGSLLSPGPPAAPLPAWAHHIGVTRVARVTGLDRCGVEVACAVRPAGHVLQLSNGKGRTFAEARRSALSEALELWACEHPRPEALLLRREAPTAGFWSADFLDPAGTVGAIDRDAVQPWVCAERLDTRDEVLLPASLVYAPADGVPVGLRRTAWTANGVAAHPVPLRARWHALLELLEREALCRVVPDGWTPELLQRRGLRIDHPLVALLARVGLQVHWLDATPAGWPVAVVAALVVDAEGGPVPLAAGYACRPLPEEAADAALREACQSRLTEIHGAREDVQQARPEVPEWLGRRPRPRRTLDSLPAGRGSLRALLQAMGLAAAAVDLSHPEVPLHVTRLFIPGFRCSELLL